MQYYSIGTQD